MSTTQTWFRTQFPNQRPTKWHAAAQVHEYAGSVAAYSAPCGFEGAPPHVGVIEEAAGVVPVTALDDDQGCCIHCQRALEMARREDGAE